MSTAGATESGVGLRTETLTPLHWAGIALAAISGVIHLWLGVSFFPSPFGVAFLVAAIGFFAGIAGVLVDVRRRALYALGVPFTAGQIVIWYAVNGLKLAPVDLVDKVAQLALVAVLLVLYSRSS
ncbi:hypothetical protein ACFO0N_11775 [Halobium salinum]|uniref:Uncharacterized protein n=1 Tax=Halobium salinum TaxID=1364940 RepID=A0ABD5PD09_9EURY|nr:hypothetical protein [Halobium salinum]